MVVQCQACRTINVTNTIFCTDCGANLLEQEDVATNPIELAQIRWLGDVRRSPVKDGEALPVQASNVRLIVGDGDKKRELKLSLVKPARLGRSDASQNIFPEVDLTDDQAKERGVSREHATLAARGGQITVEDLGSTNGTLLNGSRLDPYMPEVLKHGDQLQLGRLLIEVRLR